MRIDVISIFPDYLAPCGSRWWEERSSADRSILRFMTFAISHMTGIALSMTLRSAAALGWS